MSISIQMCRVPVMQGNEQLAEANCVLIRATSRENGLTSYTAIIPDPAVLFENPFNATCDDSTAFGVRRGKIERVILTRVQSLATPPAIQADRLIRSTALSANAKIRVLASTIEGARYHSGPNWTDMVRAIGNVNEREPYDLSFGSAGALQLFPSSGLGNAAGHVDLVLGRVHMSLFHDNKPVPGFFNGSTEVPIGIHRIPSYRK